MRPPAFFCSSWAFCNCWSEMRFSRTKSSPRRPAMLCTPRKSLKRPSIGDRRPAKRETGRRVREIPWLRKELRRGRIRSRRAGACPPANLLRVEQPAGLGDVLCDLFLQRLDAREAAFLAQPVYELDPHPLAVDVLREVEEVHFEREGRAAGGPGLRHVGTEGRVEAQVGRAGDRRGGKKNFFFFTCS